MQYAHNIHEMNYEVWMLLIQPTLQSIYIPHRQIRVPFPQFRNLLESPPGTVLRSVTLLVLLLALGVSLYSMYKLSSYNRVLEI